MNSSNEAAQIAAGKFVEWLRQCVINDATGSTKVSNETQPFGTFWLGRLASQDAVFADGTDSRGDRLDPCSIGMRFCPEGGPPWSLDVKIRASVWKKDREVDLWRKCGPLTETVSIVVNDIAIDAPFGEEQLRSALRSITGIDSLAAHIGVTGSLQDGGCPELTVTLVNSSPRESREIGDTHLYECEMSISGCSFRPYMLEALPDSFRYDRRVPAYGLNCGVMEIHRGVLTTLDVPTSNRYRPTFWPKEVPEPNFAFNTLADDPIPLAEELLKALRQWGEANWGNETLLQRFENEHWNEPMLAEAQEAAVGFHGECDRIERGVKALRESPTLLAAFRDMNAAMEISARGKYDAWRPFQFGFLLANLADLVSQDGGADVADVVWFATGGGKTETYLGLLLTAAFLDRQSGKTHGITAWSRFPLRMLSLQQTQRFANALAAAELVRRERKIAGEPFSLGFFVGSGATPNTLKPDAKRDEPDPDDDDMPNRYRLLDRCPFCRQDTLEMAFNHSSWTLEHRCTNAMCPWPERALPFYVVDDEIYRFLPTVIVGTLDKAANVGMQASMRGFMAAPLGYCSVGGHGHVYARRSSRKNGCLVPGCRGQVRALPQDARLYGPSFRLQDELHLLRDSLGAIDSHYEALLDDIERNLTGRSPKILASSATLAGYKKQIDVLYRRDARVFPQPSPEPGKGFWSSDTERLMRRYVAIAPRGVTIEHAIDRILTVLQRCVRELITAPEATCGKIGVDPSFAGGLMSLYGTNVVYGNTLRDLDAVDRSIDGQQIRVSGVVNTASLTGRTDFTDVRNTLARLEKPEEHFEDRIHIVTASSMMSHGVDIDRLNVMVMIGLPLGTAEFIQTTARVGRTWPGLVFVLHKISRERDAAVFRTFEKYVEHGDRFVEAIPITRRSRRVLERTLPGLIHARLLHVHEPQSRQPLTTVANLRAFRDQGQFNLDHEEGVIRDMLGIGGVADDPLGDELSRWMTRYGRLIDEPPTGAKFSSDVYPGHVGPMRSLRDVEEPIPIYGREDDE